MEGEIIKGVKKSHIVHKRWVLNNGEVLEGDFEFKLLTIKDKARLPILAKRMVEEMGGNSSGISLDLDLENIKKIDLEGNIYYLAVIMATLDLALVRKPDWFSLDNITDETILTDLITEYMNFENFFRVRPK